MNEEFAQNVLGNFMEPDALVAHDYGKTQSRTLPAEPEQVLMFAVLKDGLETFQRLYDANTRAGRRLFREAQDWIWSDETDRVFAFVHVCEMLGLEPGYLRHGLLKWAATRKPSSFEDAGLAASARVQGSGVLRGALQQRAADQQSVRNGTPERRGNSSSPKVRIGAKHQNSTKQSFQQRRAISKLQYPKQA